MKYAFAKITSNSWRICYPVYTEEQEAFFLSQKGKIFTNCPRLIYENVAIIPFSEPTNKKDFVYKRFGEETAFIKERIEILNKFVG